MRGIGSISGWMTALGLCWALGAALPAQASEAQNLARLERATSLFGVGLAAQLRGDLPAARDAYRAAIDDDPLLVEAMANLALLLATMGQEAEGQQWLERAESIRPEYPGVHAARGTLALGAGDPSRALESFTRAAQLAPRDPNIAANLGTSLLRLGQLEPAIAHLRRALERDPALSEAELSLAIAYDRAGAYRDAVDHYRRYLEIAPAREAQRADVEQRLRRLRAGTQRNTGPTLAVQDSDANSRRMRR